MAKVELRPVSWFSQLGLLSCFSCLPLARGSYYHPQGPFPLLGDMGALGHLYIQVKLEQAGDGILEEVAHRDEGS